MVYVCDAMMGSGKSSAAMTYMREHPDKRFIYITPYLNEVKRVCSGVEGVMVWEPQKDVRFGNSKVADAERLVEKGRTFATTHSAFVLFNGEIFQKIREMGYTLIVDENLSPMQKIPRMSPGYLETAIAAGFLAEERPRIYRVTERGAEAEKFNYDFRNVLSDRNLIVIGGKKDDDGNYSEGSGIRKNCYWLLPPEAIDAFEDVFILTYLFEGQGLYNMFRVYQTPYEKIGVTQDLGCGCYRFTRDPQALPDFAMSLRDHIHILDHEKMNRVGRNPHALSKNWFQSGGYRKSKKKKKDMDEKDNVEQLRKNMTNYFINLCKVPRTQRLWCTFKPYRKKLQGDGYARNYTACNLRATNDYAGCTALAYAANVFANTGEKNFFRENGVEINDDLMALSTMVQWVWRSAVRVGGDVTLYIPSMRMRKLFTDWMEDLACGRNTIERIELKDGCKKQLCRVPVGGGL